LDKEGGAYYSTPEGDLSILFRMKEDYDGAEPSGNSVAAQNLLRLSLLVAGDLSESFHNSAEHLLVIHSDLFNVTALVPKMLVVIGRSMILWHCGIEEVLGASRNRKMV